MDQQFGNILIPLAIIVSPLIGAYLGIRQRSVLKSFVVGWVSTILIGSILGAVVASIVDSVAARLPGSNPWLGQSEGISVYHCLLGLIFVGGVSVISGLLAGLIASAWGLRRSRS